MDKNARRVAVVAAIALIASASGVALGDFAISKDDPAQAVLAEPETLANEAFITQSVADSPQDLSPESYSCTGCDASPSNEAVLADDFEPFDAMPLPADPPAPEQIAGPEAPPRRLEDIPVLRPDRMAPDAVRRRAASASGGASGAPAPPFLNLPAPDPSVP